SSNACTPSPTPASPAPPLRPPNPPRPNATCSPPWPWTRPAGPSHSPPPQQRPAPQQPDQLKLPYLVTRPHGVSLHVFPAQSQFSCTSPPSHLWNPGPGQYSKHLVDAHP